MFVYYFVDPHLRVGVIFRKRGTSKNGSIDFEIGYRHLCTLVLEIEENFMQSLSAISLLF